ncbi:MAG: ATP-binding protein [Smithella sp.]
MSATALPAGISNHATGIRNHRKGIAVRIAVLSWLVALSTLLIFAVVTVPQQKKVFLQNLESKATSVAVSLHEAAAGAAISEDYASVVNTAQTMLAGDPKLNFLVVAKNDGNALIIEKTGWRVEPRVDAFWRPAKRQTIASIAKIPLFNKRVFHYAQPFDYSGIRWGWIHVGISLEDYDRSVAVLYRNTVLLAIGCIVFSLMISLWYSRQLVQPILRLRRIVQQIAGGDLSVRASILTHDELGSLAKSVNIMTDELVKRNNILESVRYAAEQFVRSSRWEVVISAILGKIGEAASVSHAYIFQNNLNEAGALGCSKRYEWTAQGITEQVQNQNLQNLPYNLAQDSWGALLRQNKMVHGLVSEMNAAQRFLFQSQGIRSLVLIPIFVGDEWWGFIGFDDCGQDRLWSDAERDSLRACAEMLGATMARQNTQDALLEAKSTLEERVHERTRELQDQFVAKEKALTELAETQSTLLEMSRAAGMAEVATGVLHNVGNVLNSVNVSCTLIMDQLRRSRVENIARVAELITQNKGGLARFFTEDSRGRQIPSYLVTLAPVLEQERQLILQETLSLRDRIEHIKEIVAMQQNYGRVSGVEETVLPERLMEDAVAFNAEALKRHKIMVNRRYESVPPITLDKHKVLQILLNLINNAKSACSEDGEVDEKHITLRVFSPSADRVRIQVEDNGMGIPPENLSRIFQHGFTTRKSGHGFGLHSGALAALELGGRLTAYSEGQGTGAIFTLDLPYQKGGRT